MKGTLHEDGKWRPERLEKYLGRLSQCLSQVTEETPCSFQLVRFLMKGAMKADEAGMDKVVATLQKAADSNPSLKNLLSQVATSPSELGLRRQVPFPARALAAKALGRSPSQLPSAPCSWPNLGFGWPLDEGRPRLRFLPSGPRGALADAQQAAEAPRAPRERCHCPGRDPCDPRPELHQDLARRQLWGAPLGPRRQGPRAPARRRRQALRQGLHPSVRSD